MSRIPLLSCEGVSKAYGIHPLFENVSVGLSEGDCVGLVGPNGSGKTTLLKILAGIEPPDAGTRSLRRLTRLGYVPQDPTFSGDRAVEAILTRSPLDRAARGRFEAAGRSPPHWDGRASRILSRAWRRSRRAGESGSPSPANW